MESPENTVTEWIRQIRTGDSVAAERLWTEFSQRLLNLARRQLQDSPRRERDEEDIALSAFKSFYLRAREGKYSKLGDREDLWRLLVRITANKAMKQIERERRQKRGAGKVRGESAFFVPDDGNRAAGIDAVAGPSPNPEFAAILVEEFQGLIKRLGDQTLREIAILKMEAYSNKEIAERIPCSLRTVERKLKRIRTILLNTG